MLLGGCTRVTWVALKPPGPSHLFSFPWLLVNKASPFLPHLVTSWMNTPKWSALPSPSLVLRWAASQMAPMILPLGWRLGPGIRFKQNTEELMGCHLRGWVITRPWLHLSPLLSGKPVTSLSQEIPMRRGTEVSQERQRGPKACGLSRGWTQIPPSQPGATTVLPARATATWQSGPPSLTLTPQTVGGYMLFAATRAGVTHSEGSQQSATVQPHLSLPHTALGVQTGPSSRFLNPKESHARCTGTLREDDRAQPQDRRSSGYSCQRGRRPQTEGHVLLHWTCFTSSSDETLMPSAVWLCSRCFIPLNHSYIT